MIRRNLSSINSNKRLYESIIKDISKTVKHHLNELNSDVYRRAADKRQQQFDALPSYLKRQISKKNLNAPNDLRAHADKIDAENRKKREQAQKERDLLLTNTFNEFKKQYIKLFKSRHKELLKNICYNLIYQCYLDNSDDDLYNFTFFDIKNKEDFIEEIWNYIENNEIYISVLNTNLKIINDFITFRDNFVKNLPCNQGLDEDCYEIDGEIDDYYFNELFDLNILSDKDIIQTITTDYEGTYSVFIYNGIYYLTDNSFNVQPLKKIFKYELSGDLRGEWNETKNIASDYVDTYNISELDLDDYKKTDIYYLDLTYYDGMLFSNNKKILNKIEDDLWDEHILACGGVGKL